MKLSSLVRRRRQRTALLAWEIGAGFTHSQNAWGVVRHLRHMGVRCVVATADPRFEAWFRAQGADVVQTYLWPAMRTGIALPHQRPVRVLTDVLANYAVSRPSDLNGAMAHYDSLMRLVQPDIVLAENAFGAILAARERVPVVVYGSTLLFMPPVVGDAFAPVDASAPAPSWPIDRVLDDINAGLGASARPALARAAQILDCDAMVPFGPAAFDPYLRLRSGPVHAPHCPDLPLALAAEPGQDVVVYLHDVAQRCTPLIDGLVALAPAARIYIPNIDPDIRARFAGAGHRIEDRMMSLRQLAERAGVLVHHGGVTLSAAALALGLPQVIVARFHDNGLAGKFVVERGLGAACRLDAVDGGWVRDTVETMRGDRPLSTRARTRAAEFRLWFGQDPTEIVARHAAELLGIEARFAPASEGAEAWSPI